MARRGEAMSVVEDLQRAARRHPKRLALVNESHALTFGDLWYLVGRARDHLRGLGLEAGDCTVLVAGNGAEYVVAFFAVLAAGGVVAPIDSKSTAPEIERASEACHARMVLCRGDGVAAADICLPLVPLEGFADVTAYMSGDRIEGQSAPVVADEPAAHFLTSGTGGEPRLVTHTHRGLHAAVDVLRQTYSTYFRIDRRTLAGGVRAMRHYRWKLLRAAVQRRVWLVPLAFHGIAGNALLLQALCTGNTLVTVRRFEPRRVLLAIEEHKATVIAVSPIMAEYLLRAQRLRPRDMSSLLVIGLGGSSVSPQLAKALRDEFRCSVAIGYGSTELGGGVLATDLRDSAADQASTVGRPLPGVEVRVVDEAGHPVVPNVVGELWCRARTMIAPASDGSFDRDGWYRTGDLARIDERGYVRIVGRSREVLIKGGQNIYPEEVAMAITSHPHVLDAVVIGIPSSTSRGDVSAAYVVPVARAHLTDRDVFAHCGAVLAPHKRPDAVRVVPTLPRSSDGKVLLAALRAEELGRSSTEPDRRLHR
jgi:acyl-CoA synthetase (AMP-forming)/AMP-acid ligase II